MLEQHSSQAVWFVRSWQRPVIHGTPYEPSTDRTPAEAEGNVECPRFLLPEPSRWATPFAPSISRYKETGEIEYVADTAQATLYANHYGSDG